MQHTSDEIEYSQQNLWMIDERLTFHSFISSDKRNKSLRVLESSDIQRGDIVIFDEKIIFSDDTPDDKPLNSIRSEEHTSELQSLMRISYAVFCLKQKNNNVKKTHEQNNTIDHRQTTHTGLTQY